MYAIQSGSGRYVKVASFSALIRLIAQTIHCVRLPHASLPETRSSRLPAVSPWCCCKHSRQGCLSRSLSRPQMSHRSGKCRNHKPGLRESRYRGRRCTPSEHKSISRRRPGAVHSSYARGYRSGLNRIHFLRPPNRRLSSQWTPMQPHDPSVLDCGQDGLWSCSWAGRRRRQGLCV